MKVMTLEPKIFKQELILLETKDNTIINTFNQNSIPLSYSIYEKDNLSYYVLYIKFSKKYMSQILDILKIIKNKLLLTGYTDYDEKTDELFSSIFGDSQDGIIEL